MPQDHTLLSLASSLKGPSKVMEVKNQGHSWWPCRHRSANPLRQALCSRSHWGSGLAAVLQELWWHPF